MAFPGSFSLSDLRGLRADRAEVHPPVGNASAAWDTLRQILQQWEFTSNYAVVVGDATRGRLFTYEGGALAPKVSVDRWVSNSRVVVLQAGDSTAEMSIEFILLPLSCSAAF